MSRNAAYVTLLTKAEYLPGALVVESSLRAVGSKYPLVIMVTPSLSKEARDVLTRRGVKMREIERVDPADGLVTISAHDARFADTWTKLRGFELVEYDRIVLMDCDMIVRRNMDELMELELPDDWIAACHACTCNPRKLAHYPKDWIPENCAYSPLVHPHALDQASNIEPNSPRTYGLLNSGIVVMNPSASVSQTVLNYLHTSPDVSSFSFPDQDLLAAVFAGKWKPLPWKYNALKTLRQIHKPLWRDEEVRCLHYILHDKPWQARVGQEGSSAEYEEVNMWWWDQLEALVEELGKSDPEGQRLVLENVAQP